MEGASPLSCLHPGSPTGLETTLQRTIPVVFLLLSKLCEFWDLSQECLPVSISLWALVISVISVWIHVFWIF